MVSHGSINWLLILDAIAEKVSDFTLDLGQQVPHLRRSLLMAFGHRGRGNLTPIIDADMELLPALAFLLTMFLSMPFTLTAHL